MKALIASLILVAASASAMAAGPFDSYCAKYNKGDPKDQYFCNQDSKCKWDNATSKCVSGK